MNGTPRIVIDARPLSHPQPGGFRSHVRALLHGFQERFESGDLADGATLILYVDRPLAPETQASLPVGIETRILSTDRLRTDFRLFREQVKRDSPDLVHGTMNYLPSLPAGIPTTLTVHDAMGIGRYPWEIKTPRTPRERFINRYCALRTRVSARAARRMVTVSNSAASEIAVALDALPERFAVIYNGIALPASPLTAERSRNTILAIASPDPRKNLSQLYRALSSERKRFANTLPCLDIVCNGPVAAARTQAELIRFPALNARLLTDVSDRQLSGLYASATVFAWPSRREGFGLPPLEAMRNGCAVVSSSAPAMPEILGDIPLYADPDNADAFGERMAYLLTCPEEREERERRGQAHAATFTCRRMADETLAVWREALS